MSLLPLLQSAWERRPAELRAGDVLRAFDGRGDGAADIVIDRFGAAAIVHLFDSPLLDSRERELLSAGADLLTLYGVTALYRWIHRKDARESAAGGAKLVAGSELDAVWCREGALRFLVKPAANVNGGLFLDTRDIRADLARSSAGHRVLNTFCFTGSLGLAAWSGGAREVIQVDISKAIIQWARENFAGNSGAGTGEMRFIVEDSRAFMEKELRRVARGDRAPFDAIIIDPPSFGSSRGVTFSFKDDIAALLKIAFDLIKPGGRIVATTNYRQLSAAEFEAIVRAAAAASRRSLTSLTPLRPPSSDFTAPAEDSYAVRGFCVQAALE